MNGPLLPALPGYDNPQLIAHGTTALVFRATQTRLNRPVAIKVITTDTGSFPVNAARELATTVALSSQPHIVSIIDTGVTDDDRPYIVMEYCEGGSYAQILRQNGVLSVDDVLEVGVKIGEALHAAHQVGIVHRDVKPSNILRSRFGPALTDFGIARAPDELGSTLTREMMTPHHASPEALLHQAQSGISDVYSLASTMWTLLLGHPPFVDPTRPPLDMYAFRDRVLHDALPPMTRDDVPIWLIGELNRAMSKLPAQRHGSALEFAESLRRGALGLSPAPPPMLPPAGAPGAVAGTPFGPSGGPPAGRARPGTAQGRVHVSGVPAQAWPAADPQPIGMPAPKAPPARDTAPTGRRAAQTPAVPATGTSAPPAGPPSTSPPAAPSTSPSTSPPAAPPTSPSTSPAESPAGRGRAGDDVGPDAGGSGTPPAGTVSGDAPATRSGAGPATRTGVGSGKAVGSGEGVGSGEPAARTGTNGGAGHGSAAGSAVGPGATASGGAVSGLFARAEYRPPPRQRSTSDAPVSASPTGSEYRPEARADLDAAGPADEGGWLPAAADWRTATDPMAPDPHAARRFDEQDLRPPPASHRGTLLTVLIGVAVLAIAGAAVLVLATSRGTSSAAQPGGAASPDPTRFISAQADGQPRDIRITEDRGTSVTVAWTDPTAGTVTFVVVGSGPEGEKLETKPIHRGTTTATYTSLSPQKNYCFVVGAVYAVDSVALANKVCTKR